MSPDLLQVIGLIIEFSTLPQLPDDAQPTVSQAAVGVALGVTSGLAFGPASPKALAPLHPFVKGRCFPEMGMKVHLLGWQVSY